MFTKIKIVKLFWLKLRRRASVWPWSLGHGENRWPEAQPASRGVYRLQHTSTQNVKFSYNGGSGSKGGFKQHQIKAQELSEVRVLPLDGTISGKTWKSCITHWISHLSHSKKDQSWSQTIMDMREVSWIWPCRLLDKKNILQWFLTTCVQHTEKEET